MNSLNLRLVYLLCLLIAYMVSGLFYSESVDFSYDEPHYLVSAQSILYDFDLDLKNNYQPGSYGSFYLGELDPHVSVNSSGSNWYSIHGYGLSVFIVPVVAVADFLITIFGISGGHAVDLYQNIVGLYLSAIILVSFLLLSKVLGSVVEGEKENKVAITILFSLFLVNPVLVYTKFLSVEIFPFLYLSLSLFLIFRGKCDGYVLVGLPIISGFLLFVHVKFALISGTVLLFFLFYYFDKLSVPSFFRALVLFFVPVSLLSILNYSLYDSFSLSAQYPGGVLSPSYIFQGVMGFFLDGQVGLFFCSPVFIFLIFSLVVNAGGNVKCLKYFFALVSIPVILVGVIHVVRPESFSSEYSNFANLLFSEYSEIPMWYQSPVSRFMFPLIPIIALMISCSLARLSLSRRMISIFVFLYVLSLAISLVQVVFLPNTLFRPNADFESFSPIYSQVLGEYLIYVPNLLSFLNFGPNFFLVFGWCALLASLLLFSLGRGKSSILAFSLFPVMLFIYSKNFTAYYDEFYIGHEEMSSAQGGGGESLSYSSDSSVSLDLFYGPYVYLPSGEYCVNFEIKIDADFKLLKWYVADAFSTHAHAVNEITSPNELSKIREPFCFYNEHPYYPKEFKVFSDGFVGHAILDGVYLERIN